MDDNYEFVIKNWMKVDGHQKRTLKKIHQFLDLFVERFQETPRISADKIEDGDDAEIRLLLKYAIVDVFVCIKQIVEKNRKAVLDYAIYHRENAKTFGKTWTPSDYESYVHLIACHCLVESEFLVPRLDYPLIEFCHAASSNTYSDNNLDIWMPITGH